jgi:hypothetical protein
MFIKKIFENKVDESVHKQFVRFGKGTFGNRAVTNVKKSEGILVSTSFELVNDLVEFISDLAPKFKVQGIVLSKQPLEGFEGRKKTGLFEYTIDKELSGEELKKLSNCYSSLLDCSAQGIDLKMKKKLPRPKPSSSGTSKVNEKFCQLALDNRYWSRFYSEFIWDLPQEFKKAKIEHTYIINDIVLPPGEKDFEKIRLNSKRKGILKRKVTVHGQEIVKEKEFAA